ncbi:MAG: response regulator [Xanthomonadales bacterium]|nr:response regulator [Xanthomonadales bacterium]
MTQRPLKILCIDDEARILRALRALFRHHQVFITSDPNEAMALAQSEDVDVIVCDQRMPVMTGVEVLREIRAVHPRAMRILLTGYADLQAILGSVNEGEVFRYVNKPWDNRELIALVELAGRIAREAPVVDATPVSERDQEEARRQVGILVIEDDGETQRRLREILGQQYQIRFATSAERALQVLEQHETGVIISETEGQRGDLTEMLKSLKQYHPHIATVVMTDRANAQLAIDLINEGQVYRMLLKPVRTGSCRLSVEAAVGRYWQLKQNPQAARRFMVAARQAPSWLSTTLLERIRLLPSRLLGRAH